MRSRRIKKTGSQDEQALGRSKGGFSTKIHVLVDAIGNPLRFILTGGERHDVTQTAALLESFQFDKMIADKAYDADWVLDLLKERGAQAVPQCAGVGLQTDAVFSHEWQEQTNMSGEKLVVIGGGMAGLVAAVQAKQLGAQVTLLEKGDVPGGSLALSGGTLWCARTAEDLRRLVPRGHPVLGPLLVEDFPDGVAWLRDLGATLTRLESLPDRTVYLMEPGPRAFVQQMVEFLHKNGAAVHTGCTALNIRLDNDGAVAGVTVRQGDGPRTMLDASAVILATGGFQANPEMRARYFGRWSDRLVLRSNPHSQGDGWQMAQAIGAGASAAMGSFYGHLLPAPPAVVPVHDFIAYTQYHSEQGVLVNREGARFADESLGDETNAQAVARQSGAVAFLVFDDAVYRAFAVHPGGGGARARDTFYESLELGAPGASAPSLEALADAMRPAGLYGRGLLATLAAYNEAVVRGEANALPVPRQQKANPVVTPPFYALGVTPGITFTLGGLPINQNAQVLDRGGVPIVGLYAAGADAGGIHNEQYAGGLCLGLVFGRRAARHATGS